MSQKVEIMRDKILILCRSVRKFPVVYDRGHKDYYNNASKEEAWAAIAIECQETVNICKTRWDYIIANWDNIKENFFSNHVEVFVPHVETNDDNDDIESLNNEDPTNEEKDDITSEPSFSNEEHSNEIPNVNLQVSELGNEEIPPARFGTMQAETCSEEQKIMCEQCVQLDRNRSEEDIYFDPFKVHIKIMNKRQRTVLKQYIFGAIVKTLDDSRDFNVSVIESLQSKNDDEKTDENTSDSVPEIVIRKPIELCSIEPGDTSEPGAVCKVLERLDKDTINNAAVTENDLCIVNSQINSSDPITLHSSNTVRTSTANITKPTLVTTSPYSSIAAMGTSSTSSNSALISQPKNIRTLNCAASSSVATTSSAVGLGKRRLFIHDPSVLNRGPYYWTRSQTRRRRTMHSYTTPTVSTTNKMPSLIPIQKSRVPIFTVHANNAGLINNLSDGHLRQNAPQLPPPPPPDDNDSQDETACIIHID